MDADLEQSLSFLGNVNYLQLLMELLQNPAIFQTIQTTLYILAVASIITGLLSVLVFIKWNRYGLALALPILTSTLLLVISITSVINEGSVNLMWPLISCLNCKF